MSGEQKQTWKTNISLAAASLAILVSLASIAGDRAVIIEKVNNAEARIEKLEANDREMLEKVSRILAILEREGAE